MVTTVMGRAFRAAVEAAIHLKADYVSELMLTNEMRADFCNRHAVRVLHLIAYGDIVIIWRLGIVILLFNVIPVVMRGHAF
jgi:hypothetical protein